MLLAIIALTVASDPHSIESDHYRLVSAVEPNETLVDVLDDLEALWSEATQLFGAEPKQEEPIEVFFYDTIKGYQAADKRLMDGKFANSLAFSHWDTGTSHVALQPPTEKVVIERTGVPKQSRALLVHEAGHTFMYAHFPNHRSHPR